MKGRDVNSRLSHEPSGLPILGSILDHVGNGEVLGHLKSLDIDQGKVSSVRDGAVSQNSQSANR